MSAERSFTPEQLEAIERRGGPLALAANAGSGKTSVLVERYVRSVIEDGIAPGRILAITFTDRAAGELRERVRTRLVAAGEREAARESVGGFVSTFHGFCARLLRAHAVLAGLAPEFTVLAEGQAAALRDAAFDAALTDCLAEPGMLDLAAAFGVEALRAATLSVYDRQRSHGQRVPSLPPPRARGEVAAAAAALARAAASARAELAALPPATLLDRALERLDECATLTARGCDPAPTAVARLALSGASAALSSGACAAYEAARVALEDACADRLGVPAVSLANRLLGEFAGRYEALKRRRAVVDFDDLELEAGALLAAHDDVREAWAGRFERLMVDELQDTNARQMAILDALDRGTLFTVGDEFQSIYGFRHADVALFRRRRESLAATGDARVLSANFRSRAPLLAAVNAVFAPRFGDAFVPLVVGRAQRADGGAPAVELLVTDTDGWEGHAERLGVELAPAPLWRRAEARLLAARLDAMIATGEARAEEIVVLLRAATTIGVYEAAIADLGHATLATAGGGFFARPEIVDLVAYLRALANPLDELAFFGVLASPLCGADATLLAELELAARERSCSVWEAVEGSGDVRAAAFAVRFAAARRAAADRGLGDLVAAAVAEHGYDRHLASLHAPERRIANVRKLERLAREFEAREGRDLRRFAAALDAGRVGAVRETEVPPAGGGTGAIALMTIHSAKGLEFPVVCLADLGHSMPERAPALLVERDRVGLRLPTLDHVSIDTLAYAQLRVERAAAARAEEERVIYVAMTRARERLILSGAARFERWPAPAASAIAWLAPALVGDLPTRAAAGGCAAQTVAGAGEVAVALTLSTAALAEELFGAGAVEAPPPARPKPDESPQLTLDLDRAIAAAPAAAAATRVATALSYSAIAEYERCAYRYHLQRVIGLPDAEQAGEGEGEGEGAAARGVVVHALLERLDFAAPRSPTPREVAAAAAAAGVTLRSGEDRIAVADLVVSFARSPLCARLAAAREVRREEPFAFVLGGEELLRGFLDVVAVEADGTLLIVDYKSDRVAPGADLGALVERDYAAQRLVYALAGLESGAAVVEVAHCFLRRPAQTPARTSAADCASASPSASSRFAPGASRSPGTPTACAAAAARAARACAPTTRR